MAVEGDDKDDPNPVGDTDRGNSPQKRDISDQEYSRRMCSYWKAQIKASDEQTNMWHKQGVSIEKRFRDERNKADEEGQKRINALWAWYRILKPAVFGKTPNAICERRFLDHDPTGKMSAMILERSLRNELEINNFEQSINKSVQDYLLSGRGTVWVRYEPKHGKADSLPTTSYTDFTDSLGDIKPEDESEDTEKLEETGDVLIQETAPLDYINWRDFRYYPARSRTWQEVQAVSKDVYLSKDECIEFFGEEVGENMEADTTLSTADRATNVDSRIFQDQQEKKRKVTEIWNKSDRMVYWVSDGYELLCGEEEDPLQLEHFFPCPEPLSAEMSTSTFVPVPWFHEFKDQAVLLDELTQKIFLLNKAIRACGVYDAAYQPLKRLLDETTETEMIPVDNWARINAGGAMPGQGGGGLAAHLFFLPIQEVAAALQITVDIRDKVTEDLDRVTGISDVLRGTTDARETLGGQRLKANSASTRVEDQRKDVARFVRDSVRLIAEVMAKHFSKETLIQASGILHEEEIASQLNQAMGMQGGQQSPLGAPPAPQQPALPPPPQPPMGAPPAPGMPMGAPPMNGAPAMPPPNPMLMMQQKIMAVKQKIEKALALLKNDIARGYRIDIEIDTMVGGDQAQERQDAIQFTEAITKFIAESGQIIMQAPQTAPLFAKILQWNVRKFRSGRDLEASVDEFADMIEKQAKQPQSQKPNPEQIKAQSEQMKAQAEIKKAQMDMQAQQANDEREKQLNQQDMQMKLLEMNLQMKKMQQEMEFRTQEHAMKMEELHITHQQKMTQVNSSHQLAMQKQQMQTMQPQTPFGP